MNSNATHIIRRQCYELKVATQQQGRRMQQQLQEFNLQRLLPALNTKFNEWFNTDNEVITIDKLEINIGHINPDASDIEWLEKIIFKLEEKLKPSQHHNTSVQETEAIQVEKMNAWIYAADSLIFFLQNGLLPTGIYQNIAAVFTDLSNLETAEKIALKRRFTQDATTWMLQRIAMLTAEQSYFIIQLFIKDITVEEWSNWYTLLPNRVDELLIIQKLTPQKKATAKTQLIIFIFSRLFQDDKAQQASTWNQIKEIADEQLLKIVKQIESPVSEEITTDQSIEKDAQPAETKPFLKKDEELITPEGIFMTNAGICLASSYLPLFFKTLQFTDGAMFLSTHFQQRAIHVLHFLASGKEDASEEKLVFAKLLCGWPLQMPLTEEILLTEMERNETIELLQSMIEHWQALKSTSPDGLREGFLQRNGKLSDKEDNYLLQVEHQSIDILLEYVPWQFRFIKLPWMKKSIEVEWY